jgi:hypothetical protein
MPRDERDGSTVDTILDYLGEHPDAADTVDGIRQWWLLGSAARSTADVQAALDALVARGLLARSEQPGIQAVYRRAPRSGGRTRTT